jgi:hypothetical protein
MSDAATTRIENSGIPGASPAAARLPHPGRPRFQPLRSGLVNLYRYDDQEFWFADGRLLLRGNNGTGKSRVLALQLPFLLDGEVAPHRMEPDGDPAKRAEWNLLLGGRHTDRIGYTWLELGRQANDRPDGEAFVTLGCGLSAAAGRGLVGRWFFVTPRRVGHDLHLVTAAGQPLSRERLAEIVGRDSMFTTVAAYREAVDAALFGLGKPATTRWSACSFSSANRSSRDSWTRSASRPRCPRRFRRPPPPCWRTWPTRTARWRQTERRWR